jgi:hypothetical protein
LGKYTIDLLKNVLPGLINPIPAKDKV